MPICYISNMAPIYQSHIICEAIKLVLAKRAKKI